LGKCGQGLAENFEAEAVRFKSDGQERTLEEAMAWDQVLESAFPGEVNMVFQGKSKGEWPV
jgi:hypothetical protein